MTEIENLFENQIERGDIITVATEQRTIAYKGKYIGSSLGFLILEMNPNRVMERRKGQIWISLSAIKGIRRFYRRRGNA